jgi:hypothetical protein
VKNGARSIGLKFYGFNGDRFRIVAKVIYSNINPIYQGRAANYARFGVAAGSIYFVIWALNQTSRGLYYLLFRRNDSVPDSIVRSTDSIVRSTETSAT